MNPQKLRALYFKNSEATIFSNEKIFREFSETIQKAEKDFKMPSIEKHSAENGIEKVNLQNKLINFMQIKLILQCWKH